MNSKRRVKMLTNLPYWDRKSWTNNVDTDQMPPNVASNQCLHCLAFVQQLLVTSAGS